MNSHVAGWNLLTLSLAQVFPAPYDYRGRACSIHFRATIGKHGHLSFSRTIGLFLQWSCLCDLAGFSCKIWHVYLDCSYLFLWYVPRHGGNRFGWYTLVPGVQSERRFGPTIPTSFNTWNLFDTNHGSSKTFKNIWYETCIPANSWLWGGWTVIKDQGPLKQDDKKAKRTLQTVSATLSLLIDQDWIPRTWFSFSLRLLYWQLRV